MGKGFWKVEDAVKIFDTTLRDGEQTPGVAFSIDEKVDIAKQLARLGVDIIEAGFPITSEGEFEAVRRIATEVEGPVIAALARTDEMDIKRAWEAIAEAPRPRIHVFMSTSDIHLERMMRISKEEALQLAIRSVELARSLCEDVEFSPQDATRTEINYLIEVCHAAIEAGATTINLPDTVGYATPWVYAKMFEDVMAAIPGSDKIVWSAHTHDDLGLATANALAAIRAGARQVECAVNGIGERAGNCSLEEVVMALHVRQDVLGPTTNINTELLAPTSSLVAKYTGITVPPNKAVVGGHAFAHESGIHQDGVIKDPLTYEIMRPQDVGMDKSLIVLGKHSGRHAFRLRMEELGYNLEGDQFREAFRKFKALADQRLYVDDQTLIKVFEEVAGPGTSAVAQG